MEDRLKYKIGQLSRSVKNFQTSLSIETTDMAPEVIDTIKSGQVQKFEVVVDLLWKTLKFYLYEVNGIVENSPKKVIK
ncbi:MAG: nucleotidyltransferase substrate binding protein, partial [Desulfotignum sp.]